MRRIFLFLACCHFIVAAAGEVIFVPGWLTEYPILSQYHNDLQTIYPGNRINIWRWESCHTWKKSIKNADAAVPELVEYLSNLSEEERRSTTLIGHSLGGRIVVKTATILAQNQMRVQAVILLGSAIDCNTSLALCAAASEEPVISIFSSNDSVLKYAYANAEKCYALGFCGPSHIPDHFVQYKLETSDLVSTYTHITTAFKECSVHMAEQYFRELLLIKQGQKTPYRPRYDYSQVKRSSTPVPKHMVIPPLCEMQVLDSYAGWVLTSVDVNFCYQSVTLYLIFDHNGKIADWSICLPLNSRFDEIKGQIIALP